MKFALITTVLMCFGLTACMDSCNSCNGKDPGYTGTTVHTATPVKVLKHVPNSKAAENLAKEEADRAARLAKLKIPKAPKTFGPIPKEQGEMKDGKKTGTWFEWDKSRRKAAGDYVEGKRVGYWVTFFENGEMSVEENYSDGQRHGVQKTYHENGARQSEVYYKNGQINGTAHYWDSNGQLVRESTYVKGMMHGVHTEWNSNGDMKLKVQFNDGRMTRKLPKTAQKQESPEEKSSPSVGVVNTK